MTDPDRLERGRDKLREVHGERALATIESLGDLGELFVNKERFDVYCCPRCGRVEFFVDGIGEEYRPH